MPITIRNLQSYDVVANPGFSNARLEFNHLDIDPYGEEIWGDNYIQLTGGNSGYFNLLPIARRVAAQTIGLDIVTVIPISNPLSNPLFYMDYKYREKPKKEIKRVYSDLDPYGEEDWDN